MSPQGPCFEVGPKGYFSFEPQFASTKVWTALGAFSGFVEKSTVFDRDGRKWQAKGLEAPFKKSWWRVILANTVYNPRVSVTTLWREPKPFDLEELKQAYSKAVDKDDDILTQFVEAAELKKKIAEAQSFDSLIEVYRWMETDHSYEEEKTA
jgi:hypothetical protein